MCEYVQHLSLFDYIAVSASLEDRVIEYVDHLHEHFLDPVVIRNGQKHAPDGARLQHHHAPGRFANKERNTKCRRSALMPLGRYEWLLFLIHRCPDQQRH